MVRGGADPVCLPEGAEMFRDKIGAALVEYREYAGVYHEPHNDIGKETVFKDIEEWLERNL
jgi:alpha-beta hydrolase superfamily lysophospholipase